MSYKDRLKAINIMLNDSFPGVLRDGYDLLFELWLENTDSSDFTQDVVPIVIEHPDLIQELEKRLEASPLDDSEANSFLKNQLDSFASEASKYMLAKSKDAENSGRLLPANINTSEIQQNNFTWRQIMVLIIILVSAGFIIFLSETYQKIIVLLIAVICVIALRYLLPKKDRKISDDLLGIKLNYKFPIYLSIGDLNTVHISVENSGQTKFTGEITLVFYDPDSFVIPAPDQSLSVKVEIPPYGRHAKQFQFLILKKPVDGNLDYFFQVSTEESQRNSTKENFQIAPIPYLRSFWAWAISGSGLMAIIAPILWEKIEHLLGFK